VVKAPHPVFGFLTPDLFLSRRFEYPFEARFDAAIVIIIIITVITAVVAVVVIVGAVGTVIGIISGSSLCIVAYDWQMDRVTSIFVAFISVGIGIGVVVIIIVIIDNAAVIVDVAFVSCL